MSKTVRLQWTQTEWECGLYDGHEGIRDFHSLSEAREAVRPEWTDWVISDKVILRDSRGGGYVIRVLDSIEMT